ncbi:MAG: ATP12 family protein [Maricaulaceae bacterium]
MVKRFYKAVTTEARGDHHCVLLDGRVLKTPGKADLKIGNADHAALIAAEWDAQADEVVPADMPLTRLMNVACERTPKMRDGLVDEACNYARTDLLCYRDDTPEELVARQTELWEPWLVWARGQGIDLKSTQSLIAIDQDENSIGALADVAREFADLPLTLLVHYTAVFGSAVLALATIQGALAAEAAYDLSRLSAAFQAERWGEDEEAAEIAAALRAELIALSQLIN